MKEIQLPESEKDKCPEYKRIYLKTMKSHVKILDNIKRKLTKLYNERKADIRRVLKEGNYRVSRYSNCKTRLYERALHRFIRHTIDFIPHHQEEGKQKIVPLSVLIKKVMEQHSEHIFKTLLVEKTKAYMKKAKIKEGINSTFYNFYDSWKGVVPLSFINKVIYEVSNLQYNNLKKNTGNLFYREEKYSSKNKIMMINVKLMYLQCEKEKEKNRKKYLILMLMCEMSYNNLSDLIGVYALDRIYNSKHYAYRNIENTIEMLNIFPVCKIYTLSIKDIKYICGLSDRKKLQLEYFMNSLQKMYYRTCFYHSAHALKQVVKKHRTTYHEEITRRKKVLLNSKAALKTDIKKLQLHQEIYDPVNLEHLSDSMFSFTFLTIEKQWKFLDPITEKNKIEMFSPPARGVDYLLPGREDINNDYSKIDIGVSLYSNSAFSNTELFGFPQKAFNLMIENHYKLKNIFYIFMGAEFRAEIRAMINICSFFMSYNVFAQFKKKFYPKSSIHDMGQFNELDHGVDIPHKKMWIKFVLKDPRVLDYNGQALEIMEYLEGDKEQRGEKTISFTDILEAAAMVNYKNIHLKDLALDCGRLNISKYVFEDIQDYIKKTKKKTFESIPGISVCGTEVGLSSNWQLEKMYYDDHKALLVGNYTACCQHFNGVAKQCAMHSYTSGYSGVYVVKYKGEIVSCSWAWPGTALIKNASFDKYGHPLESYGETTTYRVLMFDSIEYKSSNHEDFLFKLWLKAAEKIKGKLCIEQVYLADTQYGMSKKLVEALSLEQGKADVTMADSGYREYTDYSGKNGYYIMKK